jgi:energy-coupling factor transporter ATP-binding protein EcfA2
MPDPDVTRVEQQISDEADAIVAAGKTGYNWGAVDELLQASLPVATTRCKKANNSGRAANVLTESNDKSIDLYVVFVTQSYTIASFIPAAANRIERFPNVKTVAVADRTSGIWRVRAIVEREGVGLAERIKDAFPAVSDDDVHLVETNFGPADEPPTSSTGAATVPIVDEDEFVSAMGAWTAELDGIADLPAEFVDFAQKRRVLVDSAQAIDCLAAILSSQLLLFVGPSGTGKSSVAQVLSEFFAPKERRFEINALRQWLTPDDMVGYYSALSKRYVPTPDTPTVIAMHETSVAALSKDGASQAGPPILLVEEMNLSAPEGYLAPVFHALGTPSQPHVRWPLHSGGTEAIDEASVVALPETAMIGPYPRILGTINVDASSQAPARKVAARSSVLMFEPVEITQAELAALTDALAEPELDDEPLAEQFLGDPLAAMKALNSVGLEPLHASFIEMIAKVSGLPVSRRDATRSLAYMAYYLLLGGGEPDPPLLQVAAENAFLHCVLPTVDDDRFVPTLRTLAKLELTAAADDGLLAQRVARLATISEAAEGLGGPADFWSAMS